MRDHQVRVARFLGNAKKLYPYGSELFRYGAVGIANNSLGYIFYLLLTWEWLDPKAAVSILYPVGVIIAYYTHSKYSFENNGQDRKKFAKFAIAHVFGYLTNLGLLYILVDLFALPHQFVQVLAILTVAGLLFLLLKIFVFSTENEY